MIELIQPLCFSFFATVCNYLQYTDSVNLFACSFQWPLVLLKALLLSVWSLFGMFFKFSLLIYFLQNNSACSTLFSSYDFFFFFHCHKKCLLFSILHVCSRTVLSYWPLFCEHVSMQYIRMISTLCLSLVDSLLYMMLSSPSHKLLPQMRSSWTSLWEFLYSEATSFPIHYVLTLLFFVWLFHGFVRFHLWLRYVSFAFFCCFFIKCNVYRHAYVMTRPFFVCIFMLLYLKHSLTRYYNYKPHSFMKSIYMWST